MIDLYGRLPYGVKVQIKATNCIDGINTLNFIDLNSFIKNRPRDEDWYDVVTSIKPYLRPMSSMTDEERAERIELLWELERHINEVVTYKYQNWLNKHHFDYRGLIPMGLAIAVTKENNLYE